MICKTMIGTSRTMPRTSNVDETRMLPFAKWLWGNIRRRGYSVQRVADHAGMHASQLHKILKSYLPQYAEYQRPGYEKTVLIGDLFGDVLGALVSAHYSVAQDDPSGGVPQADNTGMITSAVRSVVRDAGYQDDNLTPEDEAKLEELFENAVIGLMEKKHRTGG